MKTFGLVVIAYFLTGCLGAGQPLELGKNDKSLGVYRVDAEVGSGIYGRVEANGCLVIERGGEMSGPVTVTSTDGCQATRGSVE